LKLRDGLPNFKNRASQLSPIEVPNPDLLLKTDMYATVVIPLKRLGSEFMPRLNEGTLMYMPVSVPGMSVTKAAELLQMQRRKA
jgi:Cu/Ag efflux pump CusA